MVTTAQKVKDEIDGIIDGINVRTERLNTLRQQYFDSDIHICAARPHLATQSWKETEGEHIHIRRAKLFARICDEIPITVRDKELIVGSQTPFPRGAGPQLDFNSTVSCEIEAGERRTRAAQTSGVLTDDDLKTLVEDNHYWKGRSPGERAWEAIRQVLGPTTADLEEVILGRIGVQNAWSRLPDYGKVLHQGLRGVIAEIEEKAASLRFTSIEDGKRWQFLQAAKIGCEAVVRYAKRHAELARQLASVERNEDRKGELETIAEVCEHVPENPARNFWEALQSVRFIHLATNLETGGRNEVTGRMDQYLYPFYKSDLEQGKLTRQQAAELLGCLWMKFVEMEANLSKDSTEGIHGNKMVLGGVDREGKDASNELTYLILHVAGQMKTAEPAVFFRCHPGTPKELLMKAAWANVQTGSNPAFHNDEQTIPGLVADGASLEDARDYYLSGCVRPFPWGSAGDMPYPAVNGGKVLELVMYNGFDPRTGKRTVETGDPHGFGSIDDWVDAFTRQWEYVFEFGCMVARIALTTLAELYSRPFISCLTPDCIQKGLDISWGGTRYPQFQREAFLRVYADTADSLIAIKKLVYEEHKLTIDEILEACRSDFEGEKGERIRGMLKAVPKYGNDSGEPEKMYRLLNDRVGEIARCQPSCFADFTRVQGNAASQHFSHGKVTGALPNGRKARVPFASGTISPSAGCDTKGPTASLRSAAKSVDWSTTCAAVLNQKMPKSLLKTRHQLELFANLIETYFQDLGGYQVQWNIQDREVYLAAKANPSAYRDLIVRVGGYNAYFIELDPVLQDEIIARAEQWV